MSRSAAPSGEHAKDGGRDVGPCRRTASSAWRRGRRRSRMKENVYFDNAATTWPKPEPVYAFMDAFFRSHGVNPGRGGHALAVEAEEMVIETRAMLARFFGFAGSPSRVVFAQNGTDALNQAIGGLTSPGDHLVTTRLEHNAVLRTVNHLERDGDVAVSRVAPDAAGYVTAADIEAAIRPDTRAIVLNHASNVIGTVQPLAEVAAVARAASLPLIVDAAQTAGVLPIDMDALGIAVLTFPGHKGLFGPLGIGGLIVADGVTLRPARFGGTGVDSISSYQPDAYPHRLEAGTISVPGIAGLHAAQHWFRALGESLAEGGKGEQGDRPDVGGVADGGGVRADVGESRAASTDLDAHARHCRRAVAHVHAVELGHLARIEAALRRYEGVRLLGAAREEARVATLSFTVNGLSTERVADELDADHGVCARAGLQCAPLVHVDAGTAESGGTVRLSPGYFTDEEDMGRLLEALDAVLGNGRAAGARAEVTPPG